MGAELHGTKPLFPASLCSSLETISLGRRALSRPRSLLHVRSCIRRLFSRKPEVLNPCQGDGGQWTSICSFSTGKCGLAGKRPQQWRPVLGSAPSCFSGDSGCCVLFWFLRAPRCHTAGAVGARLPTSHAGHQTPFPLNFHRKSFLPGGAGTRHDLALRGGRRLVKLAVPGWCPAEGHGVCSGGNAAF